MGYYKKYNLSKGGYECVHCPRDLEMVCENICGHCLSCNESNGCSVCKSGYYRVFNNNRRVYECKQCPNNCLECTSHTACSSCVSGVWGSYCQYTCSACLHSYCSKDQGCIWGCKKLIKKHCKQCPSACKTCSDGTSCSSCPSGFAGLQCQHDCTSCNGGFCDSESGRCTYVCASNEYFRNDGTYTGCVKCPGYCSSCLSSSRCTSCIDGYFGNLCSSKCYSTCKSCRNGYNCNSCTSGYFNRQNSNKCECNDSKCVGRNANMCLECSDNTWYPKSNGCCPCSENCKHSECSTDGLCVECKDGKHGEDCDLNCDSKCKDNLCYRNGSCISCKDANVYGPSCTWYCQDSISNCQACYGLSKDTMTCTRCTIGRYPDGHECKTCGSNCTSGQYPTCDPSSGACKYGCKTGWFGDKCDINCNVTNCITCFNNHPKMCNECNDGFYSNTNSSCIACPNNCLYGTFCGENCNTASGRSCNKTNGYCLNGCHVGWFGSQCNEAFSKNCKEKTCDRNNGSCTSGCIDGYAGHMCIQGKDIYDVVFNLYTDCACYLLS